MGNLLLAVDHKENRRLLMEWLEQHHNITLLEIENNWNYAFDLVILDGHALSRLWQQIRDRKEAEQPVFLPVLLITPKPGTNMLTRHLWQNIDEILLIPIEKLELAVRVQVLLRARQFSLELSKKNNYLEQEIVARSRVETALSQSLEAEREARGEAERANATKLKFLAMISHELRTPLTVIKGFADTLLAEDVQWNIDDQRLFLQQIVDESDHMKDLIEQLMDLSRLEAGTLKIVPVQQDFQRIIEAATLTLQLVCKSHQLVINVAPDLPSVYVDARRIVQVLINLTDNAVKFSPPSSQITISAHLVEERLQVDVRDQGIGIPPEAGERVFEAFQQLWNADPNSFSDWAWQSATRLLAHGEDIWVQKKDPPQRFLLHFPLCDSL